MAYYATYMPNELGALQKVVINAGVGFVLPYYGETAPPGTLACDGSEISRAAYDELFQVLGTKAGAGDGSTTFNLPDLRGQFVRGTGGSAAALGVEQGDAIRNITGSYTIRPTWNTDRNQPGKEVGDGEEVIAWNTQGGLFYAEYLSTIAGGCIVSDDNDSTFIRMTFDAGNKVPTAAENRPVNVALLWCIIYE